MLFVFVDCGHLIYFLMCIVIETITAYSYQQRGCIITAATLCIHNQQKLPLLIAFGLAWKCIRPTLEQALLINLCSVSAI